MNNHRFDYLLRALVVAGIALVQGCTMADYKTTKGAIPPPQPLNLVATQPPLEAAVHAVIVHNGPGTWKTETWWDEYVVTITNRGDAPLRLESATLLDFEGGASSPGDDPWKLERVSKQWWQTNSARNTGYALALGAGAYAAVGVAFYTGIAATSSLASGAAAATAVATVFAVAVPVTVIGSVVINQEQKHKIEAEFQHRRVVLPAVIAPGGTVRGSFFFRVSPGPQSLRLNYGLGGLPHDLSIDLSPLAALHFKKRIYSTSPAPTPLPDGLHEKLPAEKNSK